MVKNIPNPLGFDPFNLSKDSRVHQHSNSQSESSLGSVKVHSLTLSFILGLPSWPATLQALALVMSLRLRL